MTQIIDMTGNAPSSSSSRRRAYRRRAPRRRSYRRSTYSRRRYPRRSRRVSRGRNVRLTRYAMAQIDPFSQKVVGAKIPDSNTYPSNAFRIDDAWSVKATDGAFGTVAFALLPGLAGQIVNPGAYPAAGQWTWVAGYGGATNSSRLAGVASNYSLYRPVAHGVKLSCPGASTTISGNLHICVVANSTYAKNTWWFPTNIPEMSNAMFYRRYPLSTFTQQSLTLVNKFLDQTACRYRDPASDAVAESSDMTNQHSGWATIIVAVEGSTVATNVIQAENVLHIEAIPDKNGISTATPPAAFNTSELEQVAEITSRTDAAFTDLDRPTYLQEALQAATRGMKSAAEGAFYRYGVPAAEAAGAMATTYAFRNYGIPGVTNRRITSGLSD